MPVIVITCCRNVTIPPINIQTCIGLSLLWGKSLLASKMMKATAFVYTPLLSIVSNPTLVMLAALMKDRL